MTSNKTITAWNPFSRLTDRTTKQQQTKQSTRVWMKTETHVPCKNNQINTQKDGKNGNIYLTKYQGPVGKFRHQKMVEFVW
jgi:hypothetical protein